MGVDGIWAEILKTLPWRVLQKIKNAFELRYKGQNKEDIVTCVRNIIVLIPKKQVIERLEGQTRGICVQSVLAKWRQGWENLHTFGFEEGSSATEIPTAIKVCAGKDTLRDVPRCAAPM